MRNIKHPNEIDELYNNDKISISEASRLRDAWEKATPDEKKENAIYTKSIGNEANHDLNRSEMIEEDTMSNLSDREIQLEMLKAIKSTNGWIIFIGVVTLVNVIGAVIVAISLLN